MLTVQILEINDNKCDKKSQDEVVSILRKNFKLSLKVRSNLPGTYKVHSLKVNKSASSLLTEFKQYMANPPKAPPEVLTVQLENLVATLKVIFPSLLTLFQTKKPGPGPMLAHIPMARCNSVDSRPSTTDGPPPGKATKSKNKK